MRQCVGDSEKENELEIEKKNDAESVSPPVIFSGSVAVFLSIEKCRQVASHVPIISRKKLTLFTAIKIILHDATYFKKSCK